jgi:hypothetical protein
MHTPDPEIPNIPNTPELGTPLSFGPAQPLVLFPVRLETRFFPHPDGGSELRVRVYPDTVHINSHEPELTADEVTWGQHFWEQSWRAGKDGERAKAAWRQLVDRFDPPRAAWVARVLRPLNPGERPETPIAPNQPLPHPVRFPAPETKAEAWTRAPHTRMLPNNWIVLGYQGGRLMVNVHGGLISDPLATGPDPSLTAETDEEAIDKGMRWMVDFEVAEAAGMGIRARLTTDEAAAGLDFLLVLGIKDSLDSPMDWTLRLAELFDAHHYTGGLAFVAQGTPTNNTKDAPSGFRSQDLGHEESYLAERAASPFQPGDGSNGDVLTTALGLVNAGPVFGNLSNATAKEPLDAQQMNTALWQATWGYFLLQMLGVGAANESPLTDDDIAWIRNHFIDYVRANGPLPALRIGRQPYGILPVTSLNAWKSQSRQESQSVRDVALRDFLLRLRDLWRRNIPEVPRLGRSEELDQEKGIDKDLVEVLSMDGLSSSYSIRQLIGRHYLEHLWVFMAADFFLNLSIPVQLRAQITHADFRTWFARQEVLADAVLEELDLPWRPRLARALFSPPAAMLSGALVQEGQSPSLSPNYIESLLATRDLNTIRHETIQPPPNTLLYLLLRHSMLLEYATSASRLLIQRGLLQPEQRREPELVNMPGGQQTQTVWQQLDTLITVPGIAQQVKVGEYLLGFLPTGEPDVVTDPDLKALSEFRASLAHLQTVTSARLEQLMTSTLDLCSHRLDAWITSLATKRLAEMHKVNPSGVLFGGYGWVMNLKPASEQTLVPPPPGEQAPLFLSPDNPGFIHTPSLAQAATAAVLRSGHLAHSGNQAPAGLLAIDLSSERVRLATWLLDGVRQGQPLGALLGYRFERRLQEIGKAHFIASFRELAPLVARKLEQTAEPVEAIAANNVVDGLALLRRWQKGKKSSPPQWNQETIPFGQAVANQSLELPPFDLNDPDSRAIQDELAALEGAVDAVSDALMAESVYQVVRGNPLRAASTVDSIAGGETPPPELEVVRTPRTGIALTHRLVTLFGGEPLLPPEWASASISVRANAEPHLNAWTAKLLGNPAKVRCVVERLGSGTGEVIESQELRLNELADELGMAPLDFVYAVEGGQGGQQAEIEQCILYTIMRKPNGFSPDSLLRINPGRRAEWQADELSYSEFSELLRAVRKLTGSVRAIDGDDLNLPERSADFSVDMEELESRAAGAEQSLRGTHDDFQAQLAKPDTTPLERVRELLTRSAAFGVAGAIPLSAAGDFSVDRQLLLTQTASVQQELVKRLNELDKLTLGANSAASTVESRRDLALARLRIVFGKAFVVLPRFRAANATELEKALANSTALQDGEPLASIIWFQRMARVRDGIARLNDLLTYAEALGNRERLTLSIAQLPHDANDRWVGLPLKQEESLPSGKLSLVIHATTPLDMRQPLVGLLIDEWVEVVPSEKEITGITFQYNQPNAAPPQTILLAVPPELEAPWTVWSLQQVLLETLDLARIRGVDPDALDEVGHYLPALYFAFNTAGETVTTDFTKIK